MTEWRLIACICLLAFLSMSCKKQQDDKSVEVDVRIDRDDFSVIITNNLNSIIHMDLNEEVSSSLNCIHIRAFDKNRKILTENEVSQDGFWSPSFVASTVFSVKEYKKRLTKMLPESKQVLNGSFGSLFRGCYVDFDKIVSVEIKVIYHYMDDQVEAYSVETVLK